MNYDILAEDYVTNVLECIDTNSDGTIDIKGKIINTLLHGTQHRFFFFRSGRVFYIFNAVVLLDARN